jgi:hypothetical protein
MLHSDRVCRIDFRPQTEAFGRHSEADVNQVIPVKPPAHHQPGKQPKMPGPPEIPNYPVPALSAYAYQRLSLSVLAIMAIRRCCGAA